MAEKKPEEESSPKRDQPAKDSKQTASESELESLQVLDGDQRKAWESAKGRHF